jgi:hypothetical protein
MADESSEDASSPKIEKKSAHEKTYRLKTMVAVRVLAEMTVMVLLIALPVGLVIFGKFASLSITAKIVLITLALIGACILPLYGLITYKVKVDEQSVTAFSLLKKRICRFALLKNLTRRSNWNVVRYVVEYEGGELTFPVWILHCDELVAKLREHLPKGAQTLNPYRSFKQDPFSLLIQVGQAVVSLIFIGVVWCFTTALAQSGQHTTADIGLLIAFAAIISAVLLWRAYVIALMPSRIEITPAHFVVHTFFFEKNVQWTDLKSVVEPYPLLPEGIYIKTATGSFLVGNGMDSADELESTLKARSNNKSGDSEKKS